MSIAVKRTKTLVYAGVFTALGVMLPQAFHLIGAGNVFLPMHIPVILGGFVCGALWGMPIGILSVIISSSITSMPGFNPNGYSMIFELCAYGYFAGLFYRNVFSTKPFVKKVFASLIATMICGRIVGIIAKFVIFSMMGTEFALVMVLTSLFVTALPGIILQLVAIPAIAAMLEKIKVL